MNGRVEGISEMKISSNLHFLSLGTLPFLDESPSTCVNHGIYGVFQERPRYFGYDKNKKQPPCSESVQFIHVLFMIH